MERAVAQPATSRACEALQSDQRRLQTRILKLREQLEHGNAVLRRAAEVELAELYREKHSLNAAIKRYNSRAHALEAT